MRDVKEYEEKAAEFEALAATAENEMLMVRYADIAAGYRLLARDRRRLVEAGVVPSQDYKRLETDFLSRPFAVSCDTDRCRMKTDGKTFVEGARFRLSELGAERCPKYIVKVGVIVRVPKHTASMYCEIRWQQANNAASSRLS